MKVLFITNLPSPYRIDFCNELGKMCDLTVLYERRKAKNRDAKWIGNQNNNFKEIFLKGINFGEESALCFGVIKYIKDQSFDLIVNGGYSTPTSILVNIFSNKKKRPFVILVDGGIIRNDNKLKLYFKRSLLKRASAILSSGKSTSDFLIHYGAKADHIYEYPFSSLKKTDIISNVISENEKNQLKQKLGYLPNKKIVLAVGQFIYRKGFDVLINAAQYLDKDIDICFVGGIASEEYKSLVKNLNLSNINFVGFKSKEELKEYYQIADVFVLPTREDIWGLVINEAMANGLPVITTNRCVAGLELIEDNVNGFIVDVDDEVALATRINEIVNNPDLRCTMSINNLEKIKNYTVEAMAVSHYNIYKEIISNHQNKNK